jgi:replicative DNA helicase
MDSASRIPPHNLEAETSVLGSILLDNEVMAQFADSIKPEMFYRESHRKIYSAMHHLHSKGEPVDLVTLVDELRARKQLEDVGGISHLAGLPDTVPTALYAEAYLKIVQERYVLRQLIHAAGSVMQHAYNAEGSLEEILDQSQKLIFDISQNKSKADAKQIGSVVHETFEYITQMHATGGIGGGLPTGFKDLDEQTTGLQAGSLNILAARPSMGKCLAADTLLDVLDTGERLTLEQFVAQRRECVWGLSDQGKMRTARVSQWIDSGIQPVTRVTTASGRSVDVTAQHPFLSSLGWTPLFDLELGQHIAVPREVPSFGKNQYGTVQRVRTLANSLARDDHAYDVTRDDASTGFPAVVWTWKRSYAAEFLKTLFSCLANYIEGGLELTVTSPLLARDVQHLLVRFGIVAQLFARSKTSWSIHITEARSLARYQQEIGWDDPQMSRILAQYNPSAPQTLPLEVQTALWQFIEEKAALHGLTLLELAEQSGLSGEPRGEHTELSLERLAKYAQILGSEHLARMSSSELYWDKVVSLEPLGEKQVYDLTVPDGSNFVAQDICVHNTALALSIAQNVALRANKAVAVFSLEMPAVQLVLRLMCAEARVDMNRVRSGQLIDRDFERLVSAAGRLADAKMVIDDDPNLSMNELRNKCRRLSAQMGGLSLVVVDYLQLMQGSNTKAGGGENRQQEISNISRGLKGLARELDLPILVLSQLSRAVESRPNHRPMLSDLRECVTGDTLVMLTNGQRTPIRELVGLEPEVWAMAPDYRLVRAKSDLVWSVGVKPIFEVRLSSGRTLRCTAQHRVFGAAGWVRLEQVQAGDRLAIARQIPEPLEQASWSEARLGLLGHLIGDGSFLKGQPMRYTTASEENSAFVAQSARVEFGATVNRHMGRGNWHQLVISGNGNRWHPAGVNLWLRELGIFGQWSHQKQVPSVIFTLDNRSVATFLKHLWATDGTIYVPKEKPSGAVRISLGTNSQTLARDIAALLLRFHIVARIRCVPQGKHKPMYTVDVSGIAQQLIFLDQIGAFGPRVAQAEAFRIWLQGRSSNTNVDTLPNEVFAQVKTQMQLQGISQREMANRRGTSYGGSSHFSFAPSRATVAEYAHILQDTELERLSSSDIFWDQVLEIVPVGEEEVFDLTVLGVASWLADGIVSHNSGSIEQDADIVMFIYRDEYYNKETDQQGIAEIIIGKQRNGPVGTVKLQFNSSNVSFNNLSTDQGF